MILFFQVFMFLYLMVGIAAPLFLILIAYLTKDPALNGLPISGIILRTILWALFWPLMLIFED